MTWPCLSLQLISPSISLIYFIQTTLISLLRRNSLCASHPLEIQVQNLHENMQQPCIRASTLAVLILVLFALIPEWPDYSAQISLNNHDNNADDNDYGDNS